MNIIKLIQQKYGDSCQLCSPLDKKQYSEARKILPVELLEILEISNGINELMTHPNTNNGKPFIIGRIIYSFDEIKSETDNYLDEYGGEGVVFASNGAGGSFILKPDGKIYIVEYFDECEEFYAKSLSDYFYKWNKWKIE